MAIGRMTVLLVFWLSAVQASIGPSYDSVTRTVSNWEAEATRHLNLTNEQLAHRGPRRCVRLNNYWCLKDFGWQGRLGKDSDDHTAFANGDWAARAAARNFRTAYVKHKRKSALQIMTVYAPVTDCIGSEAARRSDGSCAKNNPKEYAKQVAAGITDDVDADLQLFDMSGGATGKLKIFLRNVAAFETGGLTVSDKTIEKGICMESGAC